MATFMERLTFLQKVPTLMKATADDEHPCPGYLFQEIGKMANESLGCGQCLLEYLLGRLQVESCHVKLKVLKIFVHLCGHGSNNFLTELRRNSTFIQQASVYSGPPDPIHGTALYQIVRNTAQEVAKLLFTDSVAIKSISPCTLATPTMGMGSASVHKSGMQGFGYSPGKQGTGSDTLLDKIQKAAEVVASAMLPPIEHQGIRLLENNYRAVAAPSAPIEVAVPACAYNLPTRRHKVTKRCPGQVGGGWEEIDSANSSSHNSTLDNAANSRASVGRSSKSGGTGSQSDASRESSGDLSERVEAMQLGDCGQEMVLISSLTEGSKVFLSREESQHFIKECSTLNCEVVVELLSRRLQEPSSTVQMRALCAVSCLMTSDLLSLEQIFGVTRSRLVLLNEGPIGPVANKATKILRQFEALMGGPVHTAKQGNTHINSHLSTADPPPTLAYPAPLLPTHTAATSISSHYQERDLRSVAGVTQPQTPPPLLVVTQSQTPPPDFSHKDPSSVLVNDNEEKMYSSLSEETVESTKVSLWNGEAQAQLVNPQRPTEKGVFSPTEPQNELPCPGKLSLFRGMELVNRGKPPSPCREREDSPSEMTSMQERIGYGMEGSMVDCSDNLTNSPLTCDVTSNSNHPVSAFSFLNC